AGKQCSGFIDDCVGPVRYRSSKCYLQVPWRPQVEPLSQQSKSFGCLLDLFPVAPQPLGHGRSVVEHRDACEPRHDLVEALEWLAPDAGAVSTQPREVAARPRNTGHKAVSDR